MKFEHEHKGVPFDSLEAIVKREVESWFAMRDRNVKMSYSKSLIVKPGEMLVTYTGATKDARFKIDFDGVFTLVSSSGQQSSYLKSLNVRVDKRDFAR